jgi:hypothetical protein
VKEDGEVRIDRRDREKKILGDLIVKWLQAS